MSYAVSGALQSAVFAHLSADANVTALVGSDIYDAIPQGTVPPLYVSIGAEKVRDKSDQTGRGAEHEFAVSVVTDLAGFAAAKQVAGAVSDALVDAPLSLARGTLVALNFYKATAARVGRADQRQIDVIFRARVEDD